MTKTRVPVLLLTGFLGSGKTTLVNWFLETFPDIKMSVLLNEFGDIKLESKFITGDGLEVAEIANGCMCCAARDDIPLAVNYILDHAPQTEYLLVEASGLSDPDPIRAIFSQPFQSQEVDADLTKRVRLDAILCVVDAVNFSKSRTEYAIVNSQIGDADLIIINKSDLAGTEETQKVEQAIRAMLPQVRMFRFDEGLPKGVLFEPELYRPHDHSHDHSEEHQLDHQHQHFEEYWYTSNLVFDEIQLTYAFRKLPAGVVRAKGVVQVRPTQDAAPIKKLVTFVAGRVEFLPYPEAEPLKPDPAAAKPPNGVVFLGLNFSQVEIDQLLEAAVVGSNQR